MANRFLRALELVRDAADRGGYRIGLIGGFALPFHGVMRATADVDFLVDATGADHLHEALIHAGERCLHRTEELANYESTTPQLAPIDLLYARRPATLAMLERARATTPPNADISVPVVDAEGIIGLKVQAMANAPARRDRERDDIRELLTARGDRLDLQLIRDYYRRFGLEAELDELLDELKRT